MEQRERIERMEGLLERATQAVRGLETALDEYEAAQEAIKDLEAYYGSEEWKQDFAADEAGRLPKGLKRGVLSEDALWNLLEDNRELKERMKIKDQDS